MPFVFAFIFFNLLDLDGSNLEAFTRCFDRSITDGDVDTATRVEPRPEREEFLWREWIATAKDSTEFSGLQGTDLRIIAPLEKARIHLYHVSLPRDSVPG
jgi:hypothetical protein